MTYNNKRDILSTIHLALGACERARNADRALVLDASLQTLDTLLLTVNNLVADEDTDERTCM
jgi:hypothetical protein